MKKTSSKITLLLIAAILICGIIAAVFSVNLINTKDNVAYYNKQGKRYTSDEISEDDRDIYVYRAADKEDEFITNYQEYVRRAKHYERLMDRAKDEYDEVKKDSNATVDYVTSKKINYNEAVSEYELAKYTKSLFFRYMTTTAASTFFGTYFPIMTILGVVIFLNEVPFGRKRSNTNANANDEDFDPFK